MLTVINFLRALIISGTIVYATYALMRLAAHLVLWVVRSIRRLADAIPHVQAPAKVQSIRARGVAANRHAANGRLGMGSVAAEMPQPSSLGVRINVRQAREALFTYERQAFCALSEMRETAARARETIAQARALIIEAEAIAEGMCSGEGRRQFLSRPQLAATYHRPLIGKTTVIDVRLSV
jgi:hypothetical protein